jgi:hypothetical protein
MPKGRKMSCECTVNARVIARHQDEIDIEAIAADLDRVRRIDEQDIGRGEDLGKCSGFDRLDRLGDHP